MENCIFCKIISGKIPCYKVHETKHSLAFLDIKPHAAGHTVVIPKNHAMTILDLDDESAKYLLLDIKAVMKKLEEKLSPLAFNVGWNNGTGAGQVVPHLHIHIFPRYVGDGGESFHAIIKNPGKNSVDEIAKLFK